MAYPPDLLMRNRMGGSDTQAFADKLAGREAQNRLFEMSQIPGLNRVAQSRRQADKAERQFLQRALERQSREDQAAANRRETSAWRDAQLKMSMGKLNAQNQTRDLQTYTLPTGENVTLKVDRQGNAFDMQDNPVDISGATPYKAPTSRSGGSNSFNKPTAKQQKEFEELSTMTANTDEILSSFKPEYGGSGLPYTGEMSNLIAREAPMFANEEMKDKQNWWSNYKRQRELVERHELFGSALTSTEQAQWRNSDINPNMGDDQIEAKLDTMGRLQRKLAQKAAKNAEIKNWDPEYIRYNFGDYMEDGSAGGSGESSATQVGTATDEYTDGDIVENPDTGEKLQLRGGEWQPL